MDYVGLKLNGMTLRLAEIKSVQIFCMSCIFFFAVYNPTSNLNKILKTIQQSPITHTAVMQSQVIVGYCQVEFGLRLLQCFEVLYCHLFGL